MTEGGGLPGIMADLKSQFGRSTGTCNMEGSRGFL